MKTLIRATRVGSLRLTLIAFAVLALPLTAQSLNEVFARMDRTAPQFKAVTGDLKRDVHTAVVNDDAIDSGTIRLKRDNPHQVKMLIDFTAPDPKTVSFDGANVSIYYPKIKTVQVYDVGQHRDLIDQFLLLGFGATGSELRSTYDVTLVGNETIAGQATSHVQLVPKSKEALQRLKEAELWISDATGLPAQQKFVTSSTGDFTLVTYSNLKLNPSLADNSLKLNLPKGVQIEHPQR